MCIKAKFTAIGARNINEINNNRKSIKCSNVDVACSAMEKDVNFLLCLGCIVCTVYGFANLIVVEFMDGFGRHAFGHRTPIDSYR